MGSSVGAIRADESKFLDRYRVRLDTVRKNLPQVTECAECVAERWVKHDKMYIHITYGHATSSFGSEMCARAGGLGCINSLGARRGKGETTAHDVLLLGPRSWEETDGYWLKKLPELKDKGWLIVLFASREGLPEGLPHDVLIENGAASGSGDEGALNALVNVTHGWLWCCELTSALTRLDEKPAVLRAGVLPGSAAHNKSVGHGRFQPTLWPYESMSSNCEKPAIRPYDGPPSPSIRQSPPVSTASEGHRTDLKTRCNTSIPPGKLAGAYLQALDHHMKAIESEPTQSQLGKAADIAAARLKDGKQVCMASFTHFLTDEVSLNKRSPFKSFRGYQPKVFTENLKPGDLLFYWGEQMINYGDVLSTVRATGADYIPSFRMLKPTESLDPEVWKWKEDVSDALMVLEQHWPYEGTAVPIPFAPKTMAPVSGIYEGLLYRMFDEAVYQRLNRNRETAYEVYKDWPFDAEEAKRRQAETAKALNEPVTKTIHLGKDARLDMCLIPAGEFMMGSKVPAAEQLKIFKHAKEDWYAASYPLHRVRITRPFYVGKYEITQEQWLAVTGKNPSKFRDGQNWRGRPVESVLFSEIETDFLKKIQQYAPMGWHFRLPTEAEWEYMARAGVEDFFVHGDELALTQAAIQIKWHYKETMPSGSFQPNAWGCYDVHGNVWEYCADLFDENYYANSPTDDPCCTKRSESIKDQEGHVMRGGSWNYPPPYGRLEHRGYDGFPITSHDRHAHRGLRVVLAPKAK